MRTSPLLFSVKGLIVALSLVLTAFGMMACVVACLMYFVAGEMVSTMGAWVAVLLFFLLPISLFYFLRWALR
jgi:hypothetical protein